MEAIETIEHNGKIIQIHQDSDPISPREWDNLGTILITRNRYFTGDKEATPEEIQEILEDSEVIALPVFAYIHSGIALNTGGFSDPWDSGYAGIIYTTPDRIKAFCGEQWDRENILKQLAGEIEIFSQYLGGEVYGYIITESAGETCEHCYHTSDPAELDSCWGFFGFEDCISEAKLSAESMS